VEGRVDKLLLGAADELMLLVLVEAGGGSTESLASWSMGWKV
jgi:hypothetical protein